ncbi:MAG TPA: hypothetical protein VD927_00335 [Chryseosolibacter sp.]|nr:hypothetical protein [Chryseosolibacter sp.]
MKTSLLVLTLLILVCCSSDEDRDQFVEDIAFEFSVSGSDGNDLLDPENPNGFKAEEIKLFYDDEEVYNPNLDHPRNFLIYKHEQKYRIRIFLNHDAQEETPVTTIKWNATDADQLRASFERTQSMVRVDRVLLNNSVIWIASNNAEPYYEMKK